MKHKKLIYIVIILMVGVVNFVAYKFELNKELKLVNVPILLEDLSYEDEISGEYIGYVELPISVIDENIILNEIDLIQNYVASNKIYANQPVYVNQVMTKVDLTNQITSQINENEVLFELELTHASVLKSRLRNGDTLFITLTDARIEHNIAYGCVTEQSRVVHIHSSNDSDYLDLGSMIVLAVSDIDFDYLMRAREIGQLDFMVSKTDGESLVVCDIHHMRQHIDENTKEYGG